MEEGPHTLQSNTPITGETKSYKKQGNEEILKALKRLEDKNQQLEKLCAEKSELSEVTQLALDYVRLLCKDLHDKCAQVTGPEELKQKRFLPGKLLQEKERQLKRVLTEKMAERNKSFEEKQHDSHSDNYLRQTLQSQSENAFKLSQQLSKLNRGGDEVWNVMMALEKANQNLHLPKSKLEDRLNEFHLENEKLRMNIQQLQKQQQQQSTLEEELNRLKAKYFDEKQSTEKERICLQQVNKSIEEDLRRAIEGKDAIAKQLNDLRQKCDSLEKTCGTRQNQIEELTYEKKNLEKNVTRLEVLKEEEKNSATKLSNEKKTLEEQKEAVEKDNETLKSKLYDLQSERKNLFESLEGREKKISELEENLKQVFKKKENLKEERNSLKDMKLELKEKLDEITEKTKELEKELKQTRAKFSKVKEDLESEQNSLNQKIQQLEEENNKLTKENGELKQKCGYLDLARASQEMYKLVKHLESKNEEYDKKREELKNKTNSTQLEKNKSEDQVNNLRENGEENGSPRIEQQWNRQEQRNLT